ncbi:MAG: hypothetical protein HN742_26355 [Lentisphaerae bacterium]|jgi:tetratricopeptide (TPR) repeat protein|nr:hypothetical protein [Lentisphaerota bacterium]MBT4814938.1 hypothetical protein [Lentisphaerota bacterium]MBT5605985.1 hypothetical protein [Lentisphaerota bacterium]MBT7058626.1 hypothetical protein [Lentisphaerota bacterium]MBT7845424.1 hypothetical protein [Lentisphaerota bacterium]
MTEQDTNLVKQAESLLNRGQAEAVASLIRSRLRETIDTGTRQGSMLMAQLAGLLIDAGSEGAIESAVYEGIGIFEKERDNLKQFVANSSIEYNIGNAKDALFKLRRSRVGFRFSPESIALLTEAKNHYWRAYKSAPKRNAAFRLQLLTNLANVLDTSGRVVEALQLYDEVLDANPEFPQANAGRAGALIWLNVLSGTFTINLVQQSIKGYDTASRAPNLPATMRANWQTRADQLRERVRELGYGSDSDELDSCATTREEYEHSEFRSFCLANRLALSHHSLYCHCAAASKDDLAIPRSRASVVGEKVPMMEHLLNRIKSEFAFARLLLFWSGTALANDFGGYDGEVVFTDLFEGQAVGTAAEMLRTAFRLCFGILDKVARGVCGLFELADAKETIYFESFWRGQPERWEKINLLDNYPLLGLFSQATDLNARNGEWGFYKDWRNALEHNLLVVTDEDSSPIDPFGVLSAEPTAPVLGLTAFRDRTLHLLHLVRSAIFSFVFCVRQECGTDGDAGPSILLGPKATH